MLGYIATTGCRMDYLRRELDDPDAAACGRCDNCTATPWSADVPAAAASAARDRLLTPGIEIEPRKMWPTGMRELGIDVTGKIGPDLSADPGRAWQAGGPRLGPAAAGLLAADMPDGPVPEDLVAAIVKVLAAWQWDERPRALSASRPSPAAAHRQPCRADS